MNDFADVGKTNPKQSQFQTRSEFIPKGAEIPTGELLGILKPGTNFKGKKCCCGKSHGYDPTRPALVRLSQGGRPLAGTPYGGDRAGTWACPYNGGQKTGDRKGW